ncbi:MAG: NTPase [Endomicrobiia bacterium]
MAKNLFISGKPGVGKTTLVIEIFNKYPEKFGGFYTKEFREGGVRKGFLICTTDGKKEVFASKDFKSKYKVGSYGVNLEVLETIGVKSLIEALETKEIILIDEIGKMELFSEKFKEIVLRCLVSSKKVLATLKFTSDSFTDKIKSLQNTEILELTRQNYDSIKNYIETWLRN